MADHVSKNDLNRMAQFDGEGPFYPEADKKGETSKDLEKALVFSAQLREQLSTGIADEALPDAWIELIQDTKLTEVEQIQTGQPSDQTPQTYTARLRELFAPKLAWGGGLSMALLGGLFWQTQVAVNLADETSGWESEYTQLVGVPSLSKDYKTSFAGSFFTQPQTAVRGGEVGSQNYLNADADFERIVPTIRAMELNGNSFGRLIGSETIYWIAIRGDLTDANDRNNDCQLIQISSGTKKEPDFSSASTFLSYCPSQWSQTVTFLGKT